MDKRPAQTRLLDAALDTARACGLVAELAKPERGPTQADAWLRIKHGTASTRYAVALKPALTPATLGGTIHRLRGLGEHPLLVTDHVTPQIAETLRAEGLPFLDAAGNAFLAQPGLLIWIKGQKAVAKTATPNAGRAFQPTGLQVVFVLLCDPQAINRPYRELAELAGVAHGTVGWVMPDLKRLGFVDELKGRRGTKRLFQRARLLAQWVDAYARVLRPRLLVGRYYAGTLEGWKDWRLGRHGALWGGEPAAALLTGHLRPGALTIYAKALPALLAAEQRLVKEAEPGQTAVVEVRRQFWNLPDPLAQKGTVPPVLVYADLLATGDGRCIDAAALVQKNHLARLLDEA